MRITSLASFLLSFVLVAATATPARDFAPMPGRLRSAASRIEKLPPLFAQMRASLVPARVPLIHAQTASKQLHGALDIIGEMIVPHEKELPFADRALRRGVDARPSDQAMFAI